MGRADHNGFWSRVLAVCAVSLAASFRWLAGVFLRAAEALTPRPAGESFPDAPHAWKEAVAAMDEGLLAGKGWTGPGRSIPSPLGVPQPAKPVQRMPVRLEVPEISFPSQRKAPLPSEDAEHRPREARDGGQRAMAQAPTAERPDEASAKKLPPAKPQARRSAKVPGKRLSFIDPGELPERCATRPIVQPLEAKPIKRDQTLAFPPPEQGWPASDSAASRASQPNCGAIAKPPAPRPSQEKIDMPSAGANGPARPTVIPAAQVVHAQLAAMPAPALTRSQPSRVPAPKVGEPCDMQVPAHPTVASPWPELPRARNNMNPVKAGRGLPDDFAERGDAEAGGSVWNA